MGMTAYKKRCEGWSPGGELKCILEKGHEGKCRAVRIGEMNPGHVVTWTNGVDGRRKQDFVKASI